MSDSEKQNMVVAIDSHCEGGTADLSSHHISISQSGQIIMKALCQNESYFIKTHLWKWDR